MAATAGLAGVIRDSPRFAAAAPVQPGSFCVRPEFTPAARSRQTSHSSLGPLATGLSHALDIAACNFFAIVRCI
jgi:hypothetical protein